MSNLSISIVLPAYNEEANVFQMVNDVVHEIGPLCNDYEVIVVDDGSVDQTSQEVRRAALRFRNIKLLRHPDNAGYGAAVFSGITAATKEWVFFTDADRQFDLSEFCRFAAKATDADLIIGKRAPRRDPWARRLNGWGWSCLVNALFGYVAADVDCAFKLFRRDVVQRVGPQIESRGATFSAEFLVLAKRHGFKIRQQPVSGHRPRVQGNATGAKISVIVRAFRELLRFRWRLSMGTHSACLSQTAGPTRSRARGITAPTR